MTPIFVPKNTKFGRLRVIKEVERYITPSGMPKRQFLLKCVCNTETTVFLTHLRTGLISSCGCLKTHLTKERGRLIRVSSYRSHPLFTTYASMKGRCNNLTDLNYGGRGIVVSKKWKGKRGFKRFLKWAIKAGWYEGCGLQLDRIDNNGHYYPSNCRFVSNKVNCRNKRTNRVLIFKGKKYAATELWEKHASKGLKLSTFFTRLNRGVAVNAALL